ncbi:MAG: hypothetical protein OSJ45_02970 [Lachnospiraceae bacterium]|nr:hypothetical protein [Lachnospiraceae bacterium]
MKRINRYMLSKQTVDCCHIEISTVAKMPLLRIICFVNCTFGTENLQALSGASSLARINVCDMCAEGLKELYGLKKLKRLSIRNVTGIEVFAGSKVNSFTVCGKNTDGNNSRIAEQMNKYVRIYSYSSSC